MEVEEIGYYDLSPSFADLPWSFRPFPNIYLFKTILGNVDNLFSHIGSSVEHMIFESVDLSEKQFYAILKETPNLKALTITDCQSLFKPGQLFESEADREALAESLRNVRSISLGMQQDFAGVILLRLTTLTPNLEVLNLCGFRFDLHSARQRRICPPHLEGYRSELIVIENHVTTLKELNLSNTVVENYDLSLLAESKGLNLRKIEFTSCHDFNFKWLDTLLKSQKKLLELDLIDCNICDRSVEVICEHLTNLEVLKLRYCDEISNASITGVSKLKRLKVLDIAFCGSITSDGVQQGVAKAKNDCLLELYLSRFDLCEACLIQCAENLPNLRVFDVSYCVNGVTDKAVQAIIKNLILMNIKYLAKVPQLAWVQLDAAITGINVKARRSNETTSCASSSIEEIDGSPRLDDPNNSNKRFKISPRSKAEEEIEDAKRKKAMLAIYEMNQIDDRDQEGLSIRELKGLQTLDLGGCTQISDVSLKYGLKFLELRKLSLSRCQLISMTGIQALVENCPSIEVLELVECFKIDDKCIEVISRCLHRLQLLDICGCYQLTDHRLDYIVMNCKVPKGLRIRQFLRNSSEAQLRLSCLSTLKLVYQSY